MVQHRRQQFRILCTFVFNSSSSSSSSNSSSSQCLPGHSIPFAHVLCTGILQDCNFTAQSTISAASFDLHTSAGLSHASCVLGSSRSAPERVKFFGIAALLHLYIMSAVPRDIRLDRIERGLLAVSSTEPRLGWVSTYYVHALCTATVVIRNRYAKDQSAWKKKDLALTCA